MVPKVCDCEEKKYIPRPHPHSNLSQQKMYFRTVVAVQSHAIMRKKYCASLWGNLLGRLPFRGKDSAIGSRTTLILRTSPGGLWGTWCLTCKGKRKKEPWREKTGIRAQAGPGPMPGFPGCTVLLASATNKGLRTLWGRYRSPKHGPREVPGQELRPHLRVWYGYEDLVKLCNQRT